MSNNAEQNDGCQHRVVLPLHDNAVLDRILAIHGPENIDFKMLPMIKVIEDIMYKSNEFPDSELVKPEFKYDDILDMHQSLAFKISVISCEILGSCYRTEDILETTLSMFTALSSFSWTAKGVVALAAFAVNYGHFRLVVERPHPSGDETVTAVAFLEQVPEEMCEMALYKDITDLAEALLLLIRTTWKLGYFYTKFIEPGAPVIKRLNDKLPTIISWIVQSIVVCQSLITNLAHTGYEYMSSSAEEWELSCLKQRVTSFYKDFEFDAAKELASLFPNNITVLKDVICSEEYMNKPLVDADSGEFGSPENLEKKRVLLYISTLDLDDAEIKAVERVHNIVKENQMVLVWLPVLDNPDDWKKAKDSTKVLEEKLHLMHWQVVRKPQYVDHTIIAFIKNRWEFKKTSKIMVFDSEGRLEKEDALPMILVWRSSAYPFTKSREDELWTSEKSWKIELLVTDLIQIQEEKYICLYGGEDIEWIKKFKEKAWEVATDSGITFDMFYVGASRPRKTDQINKAIPKEKKLDVWLFWARIDAMYNYCTKGGITLQKERDDPITEGLVAMRSFDRSRRGWAMIWKGSGKMCKAFADVMLKCFEEYHGKWDSEVKKEGGKDFLEALNSRISQNCETLYIPLPSEGITIPEQKKCTVCRRVMRKSFTFSCWGEEEYEANEEC